MADDARSVSNGHEEDTRDIFKATTTRERSERVGALVDHAFAQMAKTRQRQKLSRDFMMGRISANLPAAIQAAAVKAGADDAPLEYHAPQSLLWPLRMVADFASQPPIPKRHPVARARESDAVSYRIERLATGIMGELWPYRQSCDPILLDSEAASVVLPVVSHWSDPTDQYDIIKPEEFKNLPPDLRRLWSPKGSPSDPDSYISYPRKHRRDRSGKPEWDDAYAERESEFRQDTEASAAAVEEAQRERIQAKIPLRIDLLLPSQFAPINPHWVGDSLQVDGLARNELYGGTDLYRRGYRWAKDGYALSPNDGMSSDRPVRLQSLLLLDGEGCPYLIYSIDGCRTWRQDGDHDFTESIDLGDRHGLDFLPAAYSLGMHIGSANPDEWIIPLLYPMVTPSLHRDRLVAMNDFHVGQTACGGWFVKIDPQIREVMPELAQKPEWRVVQMAATPVPGDVIPAIHPGAGPGLIVQKEMLDQDLAAAGPNPAALGGSGASSGIDRALIARDEDRGLSMSWHGVDDLYSRTCANGLRTLACLARENGEPLTLIILTEMPDDDTASSTTAKVVCDPDMFGGDYRIEAWRPDDWGSDPTRQAMLMQAQKDKQATWTEMREAVGDPNPMGSLAQIFVEDLLTNTPEGKQIVLEEEGRINVDVKEIQRARMRRDQLLNQDNVPMDMAAGVGGVPVDPMAALMSEQAGGGAAPGVTLDVTAGAGIGTPLGNPAQNQLNSVAGAPGAQAAQIADAGGDASGLDFPSPRRV